MVPKPASPAGQQRPGHRSVATPTAETRRPRPAADPHRAPLMDRQVTVSRTTTPQHMSPHRTGRATPAVADDPGRASRADQLWIALTLARARASDTPSTLAHAEDAVFRFYLPLARNLARTSSRCRDDPEGAERAAELGLAEAVLAWRHPSGQGFDRAATGAIIHHLQQGRTQTATPPPPAVPGTGPAPTG